MDECGRLVKSPLNAANAARCMVMPVVATNWRKSKASVSLPKSGSRPELVAPYLPAKKIRQLLGVLNTVSEVDLSDLSYEITCYLPDQKRYSEQLDLPLSIALLSSYVQQPVDTEALFVGELDWFARTAGQLSKTEPTQAQPFGDEGRLYCPLRRGCFLEWTVYG